MSGLRAFLLVLALAGASRADVVSIDLSGTSPSTVTTAVGVSPAVDIGLYSTCSVVFTVQGATGGTLDVYLQTRFKQLGTAGFWVDVAHLPQVAAGAGVATFATSLTRWSSSTPAFVSGLNTASLTPALPVNTVLSGVLGIQIRTVYKTGAGTTAGAAQAIFATCSCA